MNISSNMQASLTLSLGSAYYFPVIRALSGSVVCCWAIELFLSSSYLWKHHLLCSMGNLGYCQVLLGNYLFLAMPFVIVHKELFLARWLFVTVLSGLFLGVSVITVQYYELFLVIVSFILVQYKLFLGALQSRN